LFSFFHSSAPLGYAFLVVIVVFFLPLLETLPAVANQRRMLETLRTCWQPFN
jgi:hypothetical protein